jgi:hypothetical protein
MNSASKQSGLNERPLTRRDATEGLAPAHKTLIAILARQAVEDFLRECDKEHWAMIAEGGQRKQWSILQRQSGR